MSDRHFDELATRFAEKIYGGAKGAIRLAVLQADLAEALPERPLRVLDIGAGLGHMSLWLAERCAITGKHLADVIERTVADLQHAVFHRGRGQDNRTRYQGDAILLGQAAEDGLIVVGHLLGFHAKQCVGQTVLAFGVEQRVGQL